MKSKKILPHIITAVLSIVLSFVAIISTTTNTNTTPFSLMEKLGIYSSDSGFAYGIANNSFFAIKRIGRGQDAPIKKTSLAAIWLAHTITPPSLGIFSVP